ncbi:DUF3630 family protein [Thalassotalea sp. PLHSN55]|uniref:DUF3630 family protein n=1 Tax=Thalassotalea sp. PLHSN55 TaxID=3435888 RepID=UPI003F8273E3
MQISGFTLLESGSINIAFSSGWFLEQTPELAKLVWDKLPTSRVVESVNGADREYFRFEWQAQMFILQFESYGQSSWIESECGLGQTLMKDLLLTLDDKSLL